MQDDIRLFMMERAAAEKREKLERYRRLNTLARPHQILFAGSSLMEQFPVHELMTDLGLSFAIYNRGIGGFTTGELLDSMDVCVYDLEPDYIYLNIGTNDLNGPDYVEAEMTGRYRAILDGIRTHLPGAKVHLLAYYPVNPGAAPDAHMAEIYRWRTNERIRSANRAVQELAAETGAAFIDPNEGITDEAGELRPDYTIDGMHMYGDGYMSVLKALLPYLPK